MKLKFFALLTGFFCLALLENAAAQNGTAPKKPDLTLTATFKRVGVDQLNVIWSLKNVGNADAELVGKNQEPLVSYRLEGSNKREAAGVAHNWRAVSSNVPIELSKTRLKPGESLNGNSLMPYIEQDNLVSYRLSVDYGDGNLESKRENNSIIAILIGL